MAWLSAGLVDLQVNGYGGEDLNADFLAAETVLAVTEKMLAIGTTTFLPTLITSSEQKIVSAPPCYRRGEAHQQGGRSG